MSWELHIWTRGETFFAHWWDLPAAVGWAKASAAATNARERVWALANWALAANLDPYARLFRAPRVASVGTAPSAVAERLQDRSLFVTARRRVAPKRFGLFPMAEWPARDENVSLLNMFSGGEYDTGQAENRIPRILRALGVTFGADLFDWIKQGGEIGRSIAIPNSRTRVSIAWKPVFLSGHYDVSWAVEDPQDAALAASSMFAATVTQSYGRDVRIPNACSPSMAELEYYAREVDDFARGPHRFVGELYEAIVEKNVETLRALLPADRVGGAAEAAAAARDMASRFAGLAVERANALRREGTLRTAQNVIDVGRGLASVAGPVGAGVGAAAGALAELVTRAAVASGAADLSEEETMRVFSSLHFLPHSGSVRGPRTYHRPPHQTFARPPSVGTYTPPPRLLRLDAAERPILEVIPQQFAEVSATSDTQRTIDRRSRRGSGSSAAVLLGGALAIGALALAAKGR